MESLIGNGFIKLGQYNNTIFYTKTYADASRVYIIVEVDEEGKVLKGFHLEDDQLSYLGESKTTAGSFSRES